jgi:hypothetical protein
MAISEEPVDITEARWVVSHPTYRVEFWERLSNPEPPLVPMWASYVIRLRGAKDAHEAIAWAEANAHGRDITVYAEVDRGPEHGHVLLVGRDPTGQE